ncbi:NUMOD1 domain-containing DNA-binding protein [Virgibacillus sp. CBA3643]|uniref:NUMOD1 domain-containing DNA-binding protein n=1 Tax=Virgibacillus sp. CBA3643 TaxID=2942278 RepID=UPI0035A398A5
MEKNRYYVYEWYIKDTNEVFYVGKGTNDRAKRHKRENKFFTDMYNSHECDYRIVCNKLNEIEAFEKESKLIKYYRENTDFRLTNILDGGNQPPTSKGSENHMSRKVKQYSLDGELINVYDAVSEAVNKTSITGISSCIRGLTTHAGGFVWSYEEKPAIFTKVLYRPYRKVVQLNLNGELVETYNGSTDAGKLNDLPSQEISDSCNHKQDTAYGFIWLFEDEFEKIREISSFLNNRFRHKSSKAVVLVDKDCNVKKIESVTSASEFLGVSQSSLSNCLIGETQTCKDHIALYEKDIIQHDLEKLVNDRIKGRYTRVVQLTENEEVVAVYNSTRSAEGFDHSSISKCCRGKQSKHKGFKWMYYKDYIELGKE